MSHSLLQVEALSIRFGDRQAVRDVSFHINAGETLALVGESGSGKSATALSILKLLPEHARIEGSIRFEGLELTTLKQAELRHVRGARIAMIFQEPMVSLNPVLSIGEQIAEAICSHQPIAAQPLRAEVVKLLLLVRIPDADQAYGKYPHQLSGGQRQRVMIAIAIASKPKLLIADEPTTALDASIQKEILDLLDSLKKQLSMGLLLITHDLGVVAQRADRVHVMHDGEIVEKGDVRQVLDAPGHVYTEALLATSLNGSNDVHYRDHRLPELRKEQRESGVWNFDIKRDARRAPAPSAQVQKVDAPVVRVDNLHVHYETASGKPYHAVRGVSLALAQGETLGLVGESGCGKTSLCRAIIRMIPVASGQAWVGESDITHLQGQALRHARRHIQYIFQDPYGSLNPRHSVREMLDLVQRAQGVSDAAARNKAAARIIDQVGLPVASLLRYPHEFSGGQRQRLGIARALIQNPRVLICDEPVSALDVSIQAQILNLLCDLKQEYQLSYLFISHDLAVVRYFSDRVLVMHQGRIEEEGDHRSIWEQPRSAYTRKLLDAVPRVA